MAIYESVFRFRTTQADRLIIRELASILQRSESDAVRYVVRETVNALRKQSEAKQQLQPARSAERRTRRGRE